MSYIKRIAQKEVYIEAVELYLYIHICLVTEYHKTLLQFNKFKIP